MSASLLTQACLSEERELLDASFRGLEDEGLELPCAVLRAHPSQALESKRERLSADLALGAYLAEGEQCRIYRSPDEFALYTLAELRDEAQPDHLRMGKAARQRLGTSTSFEAILDTRVVAPDLSDEQAKLLGEFVERLVDDGVSDSVVALAPHGGNIERYTDEQAEQLQLLLADRGASSWLCRGYRPGGGAHERWHITSTDINPSSFPLLGEIADRRFAYAVSFHGTGDDWVLVGGGAELALRQELRDAIALALLGSGIEVVVAGPDDPNNGDSPRNIVNWMTAEGAGGIQIEQSMEARENWGTAIAAATATVIRARV